MTQSSPRLLYIGDVPIENAMHGSVALFHLLSDYPSGQLFIVEFGQQSERPRRLHSVRYAFRQLPLKRLLSTRFHKPAAALLHRLSVFHTTGLDHLVADFKPEVVLTVAHGYSWRVAAKLAQKLAVPLHVIAHDQIFGTYPDGRWSHKFVERKFRLTLQSAKTVFAVSPSMRDYLAQAFQKRSIVMCPSRGPETPAFLDIPPRVALRGASLNVGYAGTFHGPGQVKAIMAIVAELERRGGLLHVFGANEIGSLHAQGMGSRSIVYRGFVPQLIETCRNEMDAMLVANSFDQTDLHEMEVNFPSKLTVYTAMGLPIVILAPPTSSAAAWSKEFEGASVAVTELRPAAIRKMLDQLTSDVDWRVGLARTALHVGNEQFSATAAKDVFLSAVCSDL